MHSMRSPSGSLRGSPRKAMRTLLRTFLFFASFAGLALHAQVDTGSISGTVRDPAGAVITNATITITNTAEGFISTANTNHDGLYTVVDLRLQDRLAIDFDLAIGQAATLVEVQSAGTTLESETTSIGQVIEDKAIQ